MAAAIAAAVALNSRVGIARSGRRCAKDQVSASFGNQKSPARDPVDCLWGELVAWCYRGLGFRV